MSSKQFSSNGANVKLVQNRKPLARAIALALMVAVPAGAWAATTFTVTGVKFYDSYPATPNDTYDNGANQDSLYKESASIRFKRIDTNPPQNPFSVTVRDGTYTSPKLFFGTAANPTRYKVWQPIDNQLLTVLGMGTISPKWSDENTAFLTIVATDEGGVKSIKVYDGDSLLKESLSTTVTIDFPFPVSGDNEVDSGVSYYCGDTPEARGLINVVLCGADATCPTTGNNAIYPNATAIQVPSPLGITDWDQHWQREDQSGISERLVGKVVAIYGTIEIPLTGEDSGVSSLKPVIDGAKAICNYGTLRGKVEDTITLNGGTWAHWYRWYHGDHPAMAFRFQDVFANFGTIQGAEGHIVSQWTWRAAVDVQIEGREGNAPSGTFYNAGTVQGGNGARIDACLFGRWETWDVMPPELPDDCTQTGSDNPSEGEFNVYLNEERVTGGSVSVDALSVQQHGTLIGGTGTSLVYQSRYEVPLWIWQQGRRGGGKGGNVDISPADVTTGLTGTEITVTPGSVTRSGRGGDMVLVNNECDSCNAFEVKGGKGGVLTLNAANVNNTNAMDCNNPTNTDPNLCHYGDDQSITLEGNSIYIDPSIMLAGKALRVKADEEVVIFGSDNWQLNLSGLSEGAIVAGTNITLAVGEGGTIDLRGVSPKAFKAAGKVEIYANNVLLDAGVQLSDLIEAQEIVTGPNKIIYRVVVEEGSHSVKGKAGETFPVEITVRNGGPKKDTYVFSVDGELGGNISGLPAAVTVEALGQTKVKFDVKLPADAGKTDKVTIKVVSSDSTHGAEATLPVLLITEAPEKVALTLTKSGEGTLTAQGIDCGTDCTEDYALNTEIKLTATPANGYQFANWSGDCTSDTVTMDQAKTCVANFTMLRYTVSGKVLAETKPVLMPLAGATVHIGDKTAVTDAHGYWKIEGLPSGNYTATVTKNGYTIPSQSVIVNGENLTFDLGVVYSAYGTIKNDQKQPVAGATITIGDKHTQTDATGYWKLDGLPAGESTLIVNQDGYKFAPEKFVLGDQEPNKEILVTPASTLVLKAKPSPWQAIRQGENVTYTYTLFNAGTQTATGVTFTETVPKGAKLVSLQTNDGGDCQADTLTCTLPNLTAGATAQVEVVLQAIDGNSFKNTATALAKEYPADVQTSYKTVKPHLSVTVTDNHDPVEMLTDLHYTATVELSPLAPVDTAKDINLVMQLPKGLELKTVTTAAGTCDSSQFPLISCQLPDLSIATPDSTSQTEVNVDVTLKDAGLLVLTNEAKVTASNYPAHTMRERTNIFIPDHIKIDMVMVIDTTNSMAPEINGVKAALDKLIATVPADQRPTMALVEFKDDVRVKAFTQDTEVMLGAVAKLVAEGGGTCPEASVEALEVALKHLKDGGTILLATDASPYPEANLEELLKRIQSGNMTFNAIISGDCTKAEDGNEMTK